jgi:hypothetical protein
MRDQLIIQPVRSLAFPKVVIGKGFLPQQAWRVTYRGFITMFHKRADLNRYVNAKTTAVPVWYFGDIPTD